ncbi:XFP N-terminal domain-containing protein [Phellopilus nigrolimitatus]|nr:XFP N-terminal domain-containing protein [Phellopilus nigrolimitatus]
MDNPNFVVCVAGDSEAKTEPTASYIDPIESGAVLPIAHVTGFIISERTIYSIMDDLDLCAPFSGYGYQPRRSSGLSRRSGFRVQLAQSRRLPKATYPVLNCVRRWFSGLESSNEEFIEGSFRAHQDPLPKVKYDPKELETP